MFPSKFLQLLVNAGSFTPSEVLKYICVGSQQVALCIILGLESNVGNNVYGIKRFPYFQSLLVLVLDNTFLLFNDKLQAQHEILIVMSIGVNCSAITTSKHQLGTFKIWCTINS